MRIGSTFCAGKGIGNITPAGGGSVHQQPQRKAAILPAFLALFPRFVLASWLLFIPGEKQKRAGKADTARPFLPGVALGVLRGRMVVVLHNYPLPEGNPSGLPHARRCASRMKRPVRSLANTSGSGYKKRAGSARTPPARRDSPPDSESKVFAPVRVRTSYRGDCVICPSNEQPQPQGRRRQTPPAHPGESAAWASLL